MSAKQKQSLFQELKRRNVFRVAIAYVLVAWILLQIADVLFPALGLPEWTVRLVAGLLILGFPLTIFFAWAFELTPDGLRREKDVDRDDATTKAKARRLDIATIVVAIVAIGLFVIDRLTLQQQMQPDTLQPVANAPSTGSKAIAVLPLVNVSSDEEQEYFSDGLTEELLSVLARGDELRVIGRTSAFQFKGKNEDLREIGRKLNVSHILEGSVRRAGNDVRISVQLIDSASGTQIWSNAFDRTLDDIFAVQAEIANAVSDALQVELLGTPQDRASGHNATAYDLYLKGLRAQHLPGTENMQQALTYFRQSLEIDPQLAVAWVQLAGVYHALTVAGGLPTSEGSKLAKDATNKALELNPNLAGAHNARGANLVVFDLDWEGARAAFARALEIEPNNANALNGASQLALFFGDYQEALRYNTRSLEVDPLNIRALHNRALTHYIGREFEAAEATLQDALDFAGGNYIYAHTILSLILLEQGKIDEAVRAIEKEIEGPFRLAAQAIVYHAADKDEEADAALGELIDEYADRAAVPIAGSYAYRGDADNAMKWYMRAYDQGDPQLSLTRVHPVNDKIQDDPRFQAFLMKLELVPED